MNKTTAILKQLFTYLATFLAFASLNGIYPNVFGATALYVGLLYSFFSPIPLSLVFLGSFVVFRSTQMLLVGLCQAIVLGGVFSLYRIKYKKPSVEIILYFALSVVPYVMFGGEILQKILHSTVICLFSFISVSAVKAIYSVKNKATPLLFDTIAFSLLFCFCGVGMIKLFGLNAYKAFAIVILLFSLKCFEKFTPYAVCGILATPMAISSGDAGYFCVLFVWYIFSALFVKSKRFFSAIALLGGELVLTYLVKFYPSYGAIDVACVAIPALIFGVLPNSLFEKIEEILSFKPNDILCYGYINRERANLSSRLYEMSGVFFQMQSAFSELKKSSISKTAIAEKIASETINSVCSCCVFKERCEGKGVPDKVALSKVVTLGIAKGRVSLIDIPRSFTETCGYANGIIFEINRLIGEFSEQIKSTEGLDESKQVISLQVEGLAKIMKGMAFDLSRTISYDRKRENAVLEYIKKRGFPVCGALILGEGTQTEISIFTDSTTAQNKYFPLCVAEAVGSKITLSRSARFNDNLVALTYKQSPLLDAVFGVSSMTKEGSPSCGDTHSLIKIDEGKFLVALSDGMGSGIKAEQTSSVSLSLIESFYRAGLDSDLILKTVNKVLAMSVDDNFTAVDIGIVDLYSLSGDFIKIGSPYGFIVSANGIKYIEGSSLPLGILEELKPTVANVPIESDDVIVLISDGISDSFGSSSEMIEFLKSAPLKNPQALSDSIVEKALQLSNGIARDDMTAVCVRLIEKTA